MHKESTIVINGTTLTEGQAMTVRVAMSAFYQEAQDLCGDELGRALNLGYAQRSAEVLKLMLIPSKEPNP